jgi:hypothetical protein
MTATTDDTCPGCGRPLEPIGDCLNCEYFNLRTGRTHYCGKDSCYCRGLRGTLRREVLDTFVDGVAAARYFADHQARVKAQREEAR